MSPNSAARRAVHEDGPVRRQLLDQAVEYVRAHPVHDISLRQLAASMGSSHPRLLYQFGSKERLLVEVMLEIRRRDRKALGSVWRKGPLSEVFGKAWRHFARRDREEDERRFFYVLGLALQEPQWLGDFFDEITWDDDEEADPEVRARRRLLVATGRGLLLDLLSTGDRHGVDAAAAEFKALLRRAEDDDAPPTS